MTDLPPPQVLGGIADTVAQSLSAIKTRRKPLPSTNDPHAVNNGSNPFISIELTDLKEKPASLGSFVPTTTNAPQPFDFERLTRFMAYGFLMAPLQFQWFGLLSRTFPISKSRGTIPALQRVVAGGPSSRSSKTSTCPR